MANGKVKAAKVKVHTPPEDTGGLDGQFHVYTFDVFNQTFLAGKVFETIERAVSFQRHEQERIYLEQEADPERFDLPFISSDPDLVGRCERDAEYRQRLIRDLTPEARARFRGEIADQALPVLGVALAAADQVGIAGDERQVEPLGVGLLLEVDALLLVTLERHRALDGLEDLAGEERLVEHVEGVDMELPIEPARVLGRGVHLDLRGLDLSVSHASSR